MIGSRCKRGDAFSQRVLIGRGLNLLRVMFIYILLFNFEAAKNIMKMSLVGLKSTDEAKACEKHVPSFMDSPVRHESVLLREGKRSLPE